MRKKKNIFWMLCAALLFVGGCTILPRNNQPPASFALLDTDQTGLGRYIGTQIASRPGQSGFVLLENGIDALATWLELVDQAERSIDAQYYLFHDDLAGRLLLQHLYLAADRGVRVRLLLDDIDLVDRDQAAAVLDLHPNIDFRVFNPFSRNFSRVSQMIFTADMGRVTRRMHNKSFIVDNQAVILGSRNIGNSYFGADPKLAFQDLDLLAVGPVVEQASHVFDSFWNDAMTYAITTLHPESVDPHRLTVQREELDTFLSCQENCDFADIVRDTPSADALRNHQLDFYWAEAELLYDQPQKILHHSSDPSYQLSPKLIPLFREVEKELIIISPYFVPGNQGVALLKEMVERGVRVRVLTNSLASTDVSIVHSGYAKYRKDLLSIGVELYELNKNISRKERKKRGRARFFHGQSAYQSHHIRSAQSIRRIVESGPTCFGIQY